MSIFKLSRRCQFQLLGGAVYALIFSLLSTSSVALPEQSLAESKRMLQRSALLNGKALSTSRYGIGAGLDWTATRPYEDGEVVLGVAADRSNGVSAEILEVYTSAEPVKFLRDEGEGLELIRQAFGDAVAQDFAGSRYTDKINDPYSPAPKHFYKGKRYGYVVQGSSAFPDVDHLEIGGSSMESISILTLEGWEGSRSRARYCSDRERDRSCSPI